MSAQPTPIERPLAQLVALPRITESPTNPRTVFNGIPELAADIQKRGFLQPVLLRPLPTGDFELVFGARRLRAAAHAGLPEILATVRDMTDDEVLETQIVENAKREGISELEEGEAFERLRTQFGHPVEDIAARIGQSVGYVYARLKLCALVPEARAALAAGKLTPSTALLVARVPAALQADAVQELTPWSDRRHGAIGANEGDDDDAEPSDPIGAREAAQIISDRFMLRLDDAPFDRADGELVATAGACLSCPKRTGNQPELFADAKARDMCTDPTCFAEKKDAHWVRLRSKAEATGQRVLSEKEAKKVLAYGQVLGNSGYVDLGSKYYDAKGKAKSYREVLGDAAPTPILARDSDGEIHELVRQKDFDAALKESGAKIKPGSLAKPSRTEASPSEKKRRTDALLKREATKRALGAVAAAAAKAAPSKSFWLILAAAYLRGSWHDTIVDVVARRGLVIDKRAEDALETKLNTMSEGELRALILELAITRGVFTIDAFSPAEQAKHPFRAACDLFKVDAKKFEAEVRKEAAAAAKAPPAAAKKSAAKKTAKRKG